MTGSKCHRDLREQQGQAPPGHCHHRYISQGRSALTRVASFQAPAPGAASTCTQPACKLIRLYEYPLWSTLYPAPIWWDDKTQALMREQESRGNHGNGKCCAPSLSLHGPRHLTTPQWQPGAQADPSNGLEQHNSHPRIWQGSPLSPISCALPVSGDSAPVLVHLGLTF